MGRSPNPFNPFGGSLGCATPLIFLVLLLPGCWLTLTQSKEEKQANRVAVETWNFSQCSEMRSRLMQNGFKVRGGMGTIYGNEPLDYWGSRGEEKVTYQCNHDGSGPPMNVCFTWPGQEECALRPRPYGS